MTADQTRVKILETALEGLLGYFRSGNEVPVERAVIYTNSKEVQAAIKAMEDKDENPRVESGGACADLPLRLSEGVDGC